MLSALSRPCCLPAPGRTSPARATGRSRTSWLRNCWVEVNGAKEMNEPDCPHPNPSPAVLGEGLRPRSGSLSPAGWGKGLGIEGNAAHSFGLIHKVEFEAEIEGTVKYRQLKQAACSRSS